jgi:hypothetical protein
MGAVERRLSFCAGEAMGFSIRWLLAAVSYAGLAFVSLLHISEPVHQLAIFGIVVIWLVAVFCALYGPQHRRPFWVGFSLAGIAYVWFMSTQNAWRHPIGQLAKWAMAERFESLSGDNRAAFFLAAAWLSLPLFSMIGGAMAQAIYLRNRSRGDD